MPEKPGHRKDLLETLHSHMESGKLNLTYILFVAPHKLLRTLEDMKEVYGDIKVTLAHELTKIHQSVDSKKISIWLDSLKSPKGEYILLFRL